MLSLNAPALLTLPLNTTGRDFIVGDLHGMHDLLRQRLREVAFAPDQGDRLIAVGDLVDRGPDSLGCLRLLREPWFHAVLGNHERMLIAALGHPERWLMKLHGQLYSRWNRALNAFDHGELREDILPRLQALPLALRIGEGTDRYYVVHAGRIHARQKLTDADLDNMGNLPRAAVSHFWMNALTRSRGLAYEAMIQQQKKRRPTYLSLTPWESDLSLTYVGHTVVHCPILHRSHLFLDRGGVWFEKAGLMTGRFDLILWEHGKSGITRPAE